MLVLPKSLGKLLTGMERYDILHPVEQEVWRFTVREVESVKREKWLYKPV
jgi:hypothetical protein